MSHKKTTKTRLIITHKSKYYSTYVCSDDGCADYIDDKKMHDYENDFYADEYMPTQSDSDCQSEAVEEPVDGDDDYGESDDDENPNNCCGCDEEPESDNDDKSCDNEETDSSDDDDNYSYDFDRAELGVKHEIRHHIKKYPELQNVICISLEFGYTERVHDHEDSEYDICYFYNDEEGEPSVRNKILYEKIKDLPLSGCVVYEETNALNYAKYIDIITDTPRHICIGLDIPSIYEVTWHTTEYGYVVNFKFDTESG